MFKWSLFDTLSPNLRYTVNHQRQFWLLNDNRRTKFEINRFMDVWTYANIKVFFTKSFKFSALHITLRNKLCKSPNKLECRRSILDVIKISWGISQNICAVDFAYSYNIDWKSRLFNIKVFFTKSFKFSALHITLRNKLCKSPNKLECRRSILDVIKISWGISQNICAVDFAYSYNIENQDCLNLNKSIDISVV